MQRNHSKDAPLIATLVLFILVSLFWFFVQLPSASDTLRQYFAASYGIMALWGAYWGLRASQQWGGMASTFGKALLFFAGGLFLQEFGQLAYSFYIYYLHVDIPYPSIGDIGFFGSIPLYILGIFFLAKTVGAHFGIATIKGRIQAFAIPSLLLLTSYFLFLRGHEIDLSQPLVLFLDFGYPFGQAIYVSMAALTYSLSNKVLGGLMRSKVLFLLIGFLAQYLADFMFLYQNSRGTWEVGRLNDFVYFVAYSLMAIALIELRSTAQNLEVKEKS